MKTALFILGCLLPLIGSAQNYSVDWHKIAGGGGTSSAGNYTLVGAIGEHDAGTSTGGPYTLEGGFLSGIQLVQATGAPPLSIQITGINAVISWPADVSTGFLLQESVNLNAPLPWGSSGATVNVNGNIKSVTVPANAGLKFYRLLKPKKS